MSGFDIRAAQPGDEDTIRSLLHELAEYEKLTSRFRLTKEIITRDFFGPQPLCCCDLGFADSAAVGVMTWYRTYSSFAAVRGIYLEDLFVQPRHRGNGYGKAFLAHLAARAVRDGVAYIDWSVLTWNQPSIAFYENLRAQRIEDWHVYRLTGDALIDLAER